MERAGVRLLRGGLRGLPALRVAQVNTFMAICAAMLLFVFAPEASVRASTSAFESAPSDPRAITVKGQRDGRADDTDAIQQALDQAAEKPGGGLVFLPSGRYRISRTLLVWPSVRVWSRPDPPGALPGRS